MPRRRLSQPVDLSFISRRVLKASAEKVRRDAGRTHGPDGRTHAQIFGRGPGSKVYRETLRHICRHKGTWRFGPTQSATIKDSTGKRRKIEMPSFLDRIVLSALVMLVALHLPPPQVMACRSGIDARLSVVLAAVAIRNGANYAVRSDLRQVFPSLLWQKVIGSPQAQVLPQALREALAGAYGYYSADGRGVPMGLPTSSVMLDIACRVFDQRLAELACLSLRYVDDLLLVGNDLALGDQAPALAELELGQYGLQLHPDKSALFSRKLIGFLHHEPEVPSLAGGSGSRRSSPASTSMGAIR